MHLIWSIAVKLVGSLTNCSCRSYVLQKKYCLLSLFDDAFIKTDASYPFITGLSIKARNFLLHFSREQVNASHAKEKSSSIILTWSFFFFFFALSVSHEELNTHVYTVLLDRASRTTSNEADINERPVNVSWDKITTLKLFHYIQDR